MKACLACNSIFMESEGDNCPHCDSDQVMDLPGAPPEGAPKSAIVIEFAGPGAALFNMRPIGHVIPEQLAVAGQFLIARARQMWDLQLQEAIMKAQEEEGPRIAVPGMSQQQVAEILSRPRGRD